jgi:hypothetical protein
MVIHWIDEDDGGSWVYSQKIGEKEWVKTKDKVRVIEDSRMRIHVVELTGLTQDGAYQFRGRG